MRSTASKSSLAAVMLLGLALWWTESPARESYGRWDKESIIEYSMKFIEDTKNEFRIRVAALKAFDGTEVELDFQYFDPMTDEQQRNHQRFLDGRLNEDGSYLHITGFLKDLERVRAKLAAAEAQAAPQWDAKNEDSREERIAIEAELYGANVTAGNLGVILDHSPSMQPYLEALRKKISDSYPSAHFAEVDGSFLDAVGENPWFYASPKAWENPFKPDWYCPSIPETEIYGLVRECELDTASAIRALVVAHDVDAIYWFCDFDDEVEDFAIREIGRLILEHEVKLYVHTLKRRPPRLLQELIDRSGGELVRERIR